MNILNYIIKCIKGLSIHHDKSMQKSEKYLIIDKKLIEKKSMTYSSSV